MAITLIPVGKGKFAKVDVTGRLLSKIKSAKWNVNPKGYAFTTSAGFGAKITRGRNKAPVYLHQYISSRINHGIGSYISPSGVRTKLAVDHINRNRLDDTTGNLRQVTIKTNINNRGVVKHPQRDTTVTSRTRVPTDSKYFKSQLSFQSALTKGASKRAPLTTEQRNIRQRMYNAKRNPVAVKTNQKNYRAKIKSNPVLHTKQLAKNRSYSAKFRAKSRGSSKAIVRS